MLQQIMIRIYDYIRTDNVNVFRKWFANLNDNEAYVRISRRIMLLEQGSFGDCKPLRNGVWELRINHGPLSYLLWHDWKRNCSASMWWR